MKSSKELLVALVAHVMSKCGLTLLELLMKYEGRTTGRCTFVDGLTNPINISFEARERGLELVVVGCSPVSGGEGYEVKVVEPVRSSSEAVKLIVDAWAGFLGSGDVGNLASALKLVHDNKFTVAEIRCLDVESCRSIISDLLSDLCTHPISWVL